MLVADAISNHPRSQSYKRKLFPGHTCLRAGIQYAVHLGPNLALFELLVDRVNMTFQNSDQKCQPILIKLNSTLVCGSKIRSTEEPK